MEEQDIRKIWKSEDSNGEFNYSSQTIERILKQGPKNTISKFIKTLQIEQWLNLVIFITGTGVLFYHSHWTAGLILSAVNVLFFFYYKNLIDKLDQEYVDSNVIQYLHEVHKIMKRFIRHYNLASFILVIPGYFLALYIVGEDKFLNGKPDMPFFFINGIGISLALIVALFLIHLLYGRKAVKIKSMIDSLSEEES
jgi:hypothetical protein